jgi:hypothetical protein
MLPILRIIPVGGVFLAIVILVLSLGAPGGSRSGQSPALWAARGALMNIDEHPEWRQFLRRAALQRADEVSRLRDLPAEPAPANGQDEPKVAGLPVERSDADPEGITGTIKDPPASTIPIDIGETSSTELPAISPEDKPPVVTPSRVKSQNVTRRKIAHRVHRAKPVKKPEPPQLSFFEAIFGVTPVRPAAATVANQRTAARADPSQR